MTCLPTSAATLLRASHVPKSRFCGSDKLVLAALACQYSVSVLELVARVIPRPRAHAADAYALAPAGVRMPAPGATSKATAPIAQCAPAYRERCWIRGMMAAMTDRPRKARPVFDDLKHASNQWSSCACRGRRLVQIA
jgi:hypothetical protein